MTTSRIKGTMAVFAAAVALSGCDELLTVSDPQRYTASDLDNALPAVANGVEGASHGPVEAFVIYNALLADEYQHTGTWSGYDEVDHGRFQYGTSPMDGSQNAWLRAQWFATDAEERFKRVMGDAEAASSPLTAQVRLAGAMSDLYLGQTYCEAVGEASGPVMTDAQMLQQAVNKFTATIQTAQSAGRADYATAALAGRAQAKLMLGDVAGAAADAAGVPAGFSYDAVYNQQNNNWVVLVTTKTFNEAAGLMHKWWPLIEKKDEPGYMMDPLSGMPDMRIPVYFDGEVATDNETPHYSQWKYNNLTDDIPMVHSDGMRLIEAEALALSGNFAGATAVLNQLRAAVGLPGHEVPTTPEMMAGIVLWERFAEHFMEGYRALDLHRYGLTRQIFDELNDPERPGSGRPTKFSLSDTEALYNDNVENELTQRCLPKS